MASIARYKHKIVKSRGKMSTDKYKARVSTMLFHLTDEVLVGEGSIMVATAIWDQEAPFF